MMPFRVVYLFASILLLVKPALADQDYLNQLILKSQQLQLAAEPAWLKLVHYEKRTLLEGYESLAVTQEFFNAADGSVNPQSELEHTLKNFFNTEGRKVSGESEPYQCAFRARFIWLDSKLVFEKEKMPVDNCERYNKWISAIDAQGLSLIFPSSYINNPASAFGHTFLRIDQSQQNEKNRLLAYTANFAAETGGEAGFSYALNGVFGGYQGFFSVAPYYEKVKLYSDMERRDIWEYPLNFSKAETDFLLAHLWELRSIGFPYYYFDQNCSYYLLGLLEAARPEFKLSESFRAWVIPIDSVRAITEQDSAENPAIFRASSVTNLQAHIAENNSNNRNLAKQLADGKIDSLDPQINSLSQASQAKIADLAYEYLNFLIVAGKDQDNVLQKRAFALLKSRSKLPELNQIKAQTPKFSPDQSHASSKFSIASGVEDRDPFYDINFRFAYHDLSDPIAGFTKGAQIELFDISLRHEHQQEIDLQKAMILDVKSLSASNEFINPLSWKLDFGMEKEQLRAGEPELVFKLNAGAGRAWDLNQDVFVYTLVGLSNMFDQELEQGYATGLGPELGFIFNPLESWQIATNFSVNQYVAGDQHTSVNVTIEQSFSIATNKALRLSIEHTHSFGRENNTALASLDFYL